MHYVDSNRQLLAIVEDAIKMGNKGKAEVLLSSILLICIYVDWLEVL